MSTLDPAKCPICLSKLAGQQVATPENCGHCFCLDCIMQWSRNTNTCPVDRIAFDVIYQTDSPRGQVTNVIKIEKPLKESEDVTEDHITCENCGRSDLGHLLVLCSTCDTGYHTECITPPLDAVPAQGWVCAECAVNHEGFSAEEDGVSDGEIADLLAEAAPRSSRLRLSTLTIPPALMCNRRSKRLCAQANKPSHHQTHNAQHVPKYLLKSTVPSDTCDQRSSADIQKFLTTNLRHKRKLKRGGPDLQ